MKFQNPSFKFFFNRRMHAQTDAHTDGHTDGRTSRKQYAPHFFKVGGIMILFLRRKLHNNVSNKKKSNNFSP